MDDTTVAEERPGFYRALGRTIRVLRTDKGLSRKQLADRAGISYSYVSAIENGDKPPSSKILFILAEALGVRSHELLAAAEARLETAAAEPAGRTGSFVSPRRSWFESGPTQPSALRMAMAEPPRTDLGALAELRQLLPRLGDEDVDLVLGLARRLAGGE